MEKLRELVDAVKAKFAGIAHDKKLHLAAGFIVGLLGAMFTAGAAGMPGWPAAVGGLVLAACAGALKELFDAATQDGVSDVWDAVYTALGGSPPAFAIALFT